MKSRHSKKLLVLLAAVLILYGISLLISPETNNNTKRFYSGASFLSGFSVELDKNIQASGKSVFDFDVYRFLLKDKVVLSAYLGWHPSFPIRTTSEKKELTFKVDGWINRLLGGYETKCFTWEEKQYGVECLVDFGDNEKGPQFVHFWGYHESLEDQVNALKIIKSTKRWSRKNGA